MADLNKDYIIYNLQEAKVEIDTLLKELRENRCCEHDDFFPLMKHIFHHINTAWNARYASKKETHEYAEADFTRWRQFPDDLDMNQ